MGYSADVESIETRDKDGNVIRHNEILLEAARIKTVYHYLDRAERNNAGGGRYGRGVNQSDPMNRWHSWCEPMEKLRQEHNGNWTKIVCTLFQDYGWEGTEILEDSGEILVKWWGGDKIGGSWNAFQNALALGIDPEHTVEMIIRCEDGDMWAERLHNGECAVASVTMSVDWGD